MTAKDRVTLVPTARALIKQTTLQAAMERLRKIGEEVSARTP